MSNVLLFSSGMDSFCLLKSYHYDSIIFFYTGTKDNHRELLQIYDMIDDKIVPSDTHILNLPLGAWELPNKIVPHRNTIMCLVAANYGNNIYIGTTKGDTTKDKDYVFKSQVEGILNYFGQDNQKVFPVGYPYQIIMPFKDLTKTEILARYLEAGNDIKPLLRYSRSCYSGDDRECGMCRSCLRKVIALKNNNINYQNIFKVDPLKVDWPSDVILKMKSRPSEWQEYQKALNA